MTRPSVLPRNQRQLVDSLNETRLDLDACERDAPELERRSKAARSDGFSPTSPGMNPGSGGHDDCGPVLRTVMLRNGFNPSNDAPDDQDDREHDPVRTHNRKMLEALAEVRRWARIADSHRRQAFPADVPDDTGEPGCCVCERATNPSTNRKVFSPVKAKARCQTCLDYLNANGEDSPPAVVLARDGKRRQRVEPKFETTRYSTAWADGKAS